MKPVPGVLLVGEAARNSGLASRTPRWGEALPTRGLFREAASERCTFFHNLVPRAFPVTAPTMKGKALGTRLLFSGSNYVKRYGFTSWSVQKGRENCQLCI